MRKIVLPILGVAIPLIILGGAIGVSRVAAQVAAGPVQPIFFQHSVHAGTLQIQCTFCHRNAEQGAAATVPAVEQCMFCHNVAGKALPEVQKVLAAWADGDPQKQTPIDWIRVHRVPDHVKFAHEPHIRAGFECSTCHGAVETMDQVRQVRPLNMSDCVTCHRQNDAPTDCVTCHN
ncbi:MAG: cytochrome c3 family protein [Chloroflexi bacterium]|nr:cytochrome c3 family protein [Chloroflexota bacterium]